MFEQTFVHPGGAVRRPWSMAASLAVQATLTVLIIALPFVRTAEIAWKPPRAVYLLPQLERKAPVAPNSASTATSAARPTFDVRLRAPARIPDSVAKIVDEMPVPDVHTDLFSGASSGSVQFLEPAVGRVAPPPAPVEVPATNPPRQTSLKVGGDIQQAMLLHQVVPTYPPLARLARVSGKVLLAAVIAPNGTVQKLQVISGLPLLVDAAVRAVRQWTYKPTRLNGEPVEVITEITVNFTLSQ
jgi:periplasmic protein TonB